MGCIERPDDDDGDYGETERERDGQSESGTDHMRERPTDREKDQERVSDG